MLGREARVLLYGTVKDCGVWVTVREVSTNYGVAVGRWVVTSSRVKVVMER